MVFTEHARTREIRVAEARLACLQGAWKAGKGQTSTDKRALVGGSEWTGRTRRGQDDATAGVN